MSTFAIFGSDTLLGEELREHLGQRPDLCDELRLLTLDPEQAGGLTDFRGAAAMVEGLDQDAAAALGLAFLCSPSREKIDRFRALAPDVPLVLIAGDGGDPHGASPVVAGVNGEAARQSNPLLSPHAGVVAVAHLLHPLAGCEPLAASASLILPVSMREKKGMDELFEQTRALLSFQSEWPQGVLGRQLAFNLVPAASDAASLAAQASSVVGGGTSISLQLLRAGVFHGLGVSLHLRCRERATADEITAALRQHPYLEVVDDCEQAALIDAAGNELLQVAPAVAVPDRPGEFWLWGVVDNLVLGGALNALRIAEAILSPDGA